MDILTTLTLLSAAAWLYLLLMRGRFWAADQRLAETVTPRRVWPSVIAVMPARNEAALIERSLATLRRQSYEGSFSIVVVDDHSDDGTAEAAARAGEGNGHPVLTVKAGTPPAHWSGKVWAMSQGVERARQLLPQTKYFWFTDADVEHDPQVLSQLVQQAEYSMLDMVSTMVLLRCRGFWERLLIPAFVFFFQKLYPFRHVNNPERSAAAAAGGSMLVRRTALNEAGGLTAIGSAWIDDCALGRLLKARGQIWLGLTTRSRSIRSYGLKGVWNMVTRTAYTQLEHSPLRLALTVVAMVGVYLLPVAATIVGLVAGDWVLCGLGAGAWVLMTIAYGPTLRLYGQSPVRGLLLPFSALLYVLMTVDSARRRGRGEGGRWKGRAQPRPAE
ncbi:MAG: glycosyltransferase [Gammaproteobacteria bacterium]